MKKNNVINKTISIILLFIFCSAEPVFAQDQAVAQTSGFVIDANMVLVFAVALLALVIGALAYTLNASLDLYKRRKEAEKRKNNSSFKTILIGFICLGSIQAIAQDGTASTTVGIFSDSNVLRYLLLGIITLELIAIFAMVYWIRFFTGIEDLQKEKEVERKVKLKDASSWWSRFNKLKPMDEEASLDVGHSYDGIKELDNVTPPWFTIAFIITIIIGLGYLWRYHVAESAPNQIEEYNISVTKANLAKEAYLKLKGDAVNENTVTMADATGIAEGKKLYLANCVACHGNNLQGGVGPNLTDDYWLHGGSLGDVFKLIKLGAVEKGMMSWKDVFSAEQIGLIASYIKSEKGSNPAGAKEPQGEIYTEVKNTENTTTSPSDSSVKSIATL